MKQPTGPVQQLTFAAVVAALYAALTLCTPAITYGPVQFRLSEALAVLPFAYPAAVPGLFIGCLVANLLSPYGLVDILCGSAATLWRRFGQHGCRGATWRPCHRWSAMD